MRAKAALVEEFSQAEKGVSRRGGEFCSGVIFLDGRKDHNHGGTRSRTGECGTCERDVAGQKCLEQK